MEAKNKTKQPYPGVAQAWNPNTAGRLRLEGNKFEASQGSLVRACLRRGNGRGSGQNRRQKEKRKKKGRKRKREKGRGGEEEMET